MNTKKFFLFFLFFILGIVIGFFYSKFFYMDIFYKNGWRDAMERVRSSGYFDFDHSSETKTLSGTVIYVGTDSVKFKPNFINPLNDPNLDIRTVSIASDTKISKIERVDGRKLQNDMDKYLREKNSGSAINDGLAPSQFSQLEISITDIKIGDQVQVECADFIGDKSSFIGRNVIISKFE